MLTTISNDKLRVSIDSEGAQLQSVCLNNREYLWQGDPAIWARRAPILFPIVGSLMDDQAQSAQGPIELKRHGLARLHTHDVREVTDTKVVYELCANDETRACYPYDFKLNVIFALEEDHLVQTFIVTNTGSVSLPYTIGAHPAFICPLNDEDDLVELDFSDFELQFSQAWSASTPAITSDGRMDYAVQTPLLSNSATLPLSHELFDDLLTLVLTEVPGRTVWLASPGSDHGVEVQFPDFPYLGIWTASNEANFVAIEPWVGVTNCLDEDSTFEHKRNMQVLNPGESRSYTMTIRPF